MDEIGTEILKKIFVQYKMSEKILIFDNNGIIKNTFHKRRQPIDVDRANVKRVAISNKDSYGIKNVQLNTSLDT